MVLVAFSSSLNSQDSCSFAGTGIQTCDGSNGGDNLSASSLWSIWHTLNPIKNCFESLLFMIHSIIRLLGCILVIWFWLTYLDYCKIIFLIEICVTIVIEFNEFCIKIYSHNFILIDTFTWLIDLSDFHHTLLYLLAKNW